MQPVKNTRAEITLHRAKRTEKLAVLINGRLKTTASSFIAFHFNVITRVRRLDRENTMIRVQLGHCSCFSTLNYTVH